MMKRNEAVQRLAIAGRLSMAHAEDLYDSLFEKPVVPQYVADWYEVNKEYLDYNIWEFVKHWDMQPEDEFKKWMNDDDKKPIITLVNMRQFGYEVDEEARYTVRVKGVDGYGRYLNRNLDNQYWFLASDNETGSYRTKHTRKELEDADFGWVFDCPGVEVKEVTDE